MYFIAQRPGWGFDWLAVTRNRAIEEGLWCMVGSQSKSKGHLRCVLQSRLLSRISKDVMTGQCEWTGQ